MKNLKLTVKGLSEAGTVGLNIEDFQHETGNLYPLKTQLEKIETIKEIGEPLVVEMFINARTDALRYYEGDYDDKFAETVEGSRLCTPNGPSEV